MESITNLDSLVPDDAMVTEPVQHESVETNHYDDDVQYITFQRDLEKYSSMLGHLEK